MLLCLSVDRRRESFGLGGIIYCLWNVVHYSGSMGGRARYAAILVLRCYKTQWFLVLAFKLLRNRTALCSCLVATFIAICNFMVVSRLRSL